MTNIGGDLAVTTPVAKWNDAIDFGGGTWTPSGGTPAPADD